MKDNNTKTDTKQSRDSAKCIDITINDCEIGSAEGNTSTDINTREFALGAVKVIGDSDEEKDVRFYDFLVGI